MVGHKSISFTHDSEEKYNPSRHPRYTSPKRQATNYDDAPTVNGDDNKRPYLYSGPVFTNRRFYRPNNNRVRSQQDDARLVNGSARDINEMYYGTGKQDNKPKAPLSPGIMPYPSKNKENGALSMTSESWQSYTTNGEFGYVTRKKRQAPRPPNGHVKKQLATPIKEISEVEFLENAKKTSETEVVKPSKIQIPPIIASMVSLPLSPTSDPPTPPPLLGKKYDEVKDADIAIPIQELPRQPSSSPTPEQHKPENAEPETCPPPPEEEKDDPPADYDTRPSSLAIEIPPVPTTSQQEQPVEAPADYDTTPASSPPKGQLKPVPSTSPVPPHETPADYDSTPPASPVKEQPAPVHVSRQVILPEAPPPPSQKTIVVVAPILQKPAPIMAKPPTPPPLPPAPPPLPTTKVIVGLQRGTTSIAVKQTQPEQQPQQQQPQIGPDFYQQLKSEIQKSVDKRVQSGAPVTPPEKTPTLDTMFMGELRGAVAAREGRLKRGSLKMNHKLPIGNIEERMNMIKKAPSFKTSFKPRFSPPQTRAPGKYSPPAPIQLSPTLPRTLPKPQNGKGSSSSSADGSELNWTPAVDLDDAFVDDIDGDTSTNEITARGNDMPRNFKVDIAKCQQAAPPTKEVNPNRFKKSLRGALKTMRKSIGRRNKVKHLLKQGWEIYTPDTYDKPPDDVVVIERVEKRPAYAYHPDKNEVMFIPQYANVIVTKDGKKFREDEIPKVNLIHPSKKVEPQPSTSKQQSNISASNGSNPIGSGIEGHAYQLNGSSQSPTRSNPMFTETTQTDPEQPRYGFAPSPVPGRAAPRVGKRPNVNQVWSFEPKSGDWSGPALTSSSSSNIARHPDSVVKNTNTGSTTNIGIGGNTSPLGIAVH